MRRLELLCLMGVATLGGACGTARAMRHVGSPGASPRTDDADCGAGGSACPPPTRYSLLPVLRAGETRRYHVEYVSASRFTVRATGQQGGYQMTIALDQILEVLEVRPDRTTVVREHFERVSVGGEGPLAPAVRNVFGAHASDFVATVTYGPDGTLQHIERSGWNVDPTGLAQQFMPFNRRGYIPAAPVSIGDTWTATEAPGAGAPRGSREALTRYTLTGLLADPARVVLTASTREAVSDAPPVTEGSRTTEGSLELSLGDFDVVRSSRTTENRVDQGPEHRDVILTTTVRERVERLVP